MFSQQGVLRTVVVHGDTSEHRHELVGVGTWVDVDVAVRVVVPMLFRILSHLLFG